MENQAIPTTIVPAGNLLRYGLWGAQVLLFAAFILFGCQKLFMAPEALAAMWTTQWPVEHTTLLRFTGVIDIAGGLGILLPSLTRIMPGLGVLAALGCTVLQIAAIVFHMSRGEFAGLPLNFVLLALSAFVLWGRGKRLPILPRA